jgi:hypothetical protein
VKQQIATLERARAVKKVSKYFAPVGGDDAAQSIAEAGEHASEAAGSTTLAPARRARIAQAISELEAEAAPSEAAAVPPAGDPAAPKIVRPPAAWANIRAQLRNGGRLTAAEKVARVRAEEEAAARASLAARR